MINKLLGRPINGKTLSMNQNDMMIGKVWRANGSIMAMNTPVSTAESGNYGNQIHSARISMCLTPTITITMATPVVPILTQTQIHTIIVDLTYKPYIFNTIHN